MKDHRVVISVTVDGEVRPDLEVTILHDDKQTLRFALAPENAGEHILTFWQNALS